VCSVVYGVATIFFSVKLNLTNSAFALHRAMSNSKIPTVLTKCAAKKSMFVISEDSLETRNVLLDVLISTAQITEAHTQYVKNLITM